jgi:hypothetical protein
MAQMRLRMAASPQASDWYRPLRQIQSLGCRYSRPSSLAGLHAARAAHHGQFFTPEPLARYVWSIAEPAMQRTLEKYPGGRIALFDNSIGTGRLIQFADPACHTLSGVDTHAASIAALAETADTAGFSSDFINCSMAEIQPRGYDIGLINPPFSLNLQSPFLQPFACTTWGRYGPSTGAVSHAYAVHHALAACAIVIAIVPRPFALEAGNDPALAARLAAVINPPSNAFAGEANVRVSILVFGPGLSPTAVRRLTLKSLDEPAPDFGLACSATSHRPSLNRGSIDESLPAVTIPVTGNRQVKVAHTGRKIILRFFCGLTQAKVLNAIYRETVPNNDKTRHRYPKGIKFTGQGVLDIEVHLAQPNPLASFQAFVTTICSAGGDPVVDPGLRLYLARRVRRLASERTPLRHIVYRPRGAPGHGSRLQARALTTHLADPGVWGSPVVEQRQTVELVRTEANGSRYVMDIGGREYTLNASEIKARFEIIGDQREPGWQEVHTGLMARFPALAQALRCRAHHFGIDGWLNWVYQLEDLIECLLRPRGCIAAWEMGLGKARLAIALCLLSECRHCLIVVESGLIPELKAEIAKLPIDSATWNVIRRPEDCLELRQINVISYERLRRPIAPANPRRTYARRLRRRIGLLVADEGDKLSHRDSQQSRALYALSAKRRYILTGTPAGNYPRDVLPLIAFTGGDGTASQPYGYYHAYLDPKLRQSMAYAERGVDRFRSDFVTLEWVTYEFEDDLQHGGKREVPKINNLDTYRAILAPHIKRRLAAEPEVSAYVKIPEPSITDVMVEWDDAHLAYYLMVAEEFADWYRDYRRRCGASGRQTNLVTILARIGAVRFAANYPQHASEGFDAYTAMTSKQRRIVERVVELAANGYKIVLFAHHPACLERLKRTLASQQINATLYHGEIPITRRTQALNDTFRFGPSPVLLSSYGVTKKGLNIPQADRALFYARDWSAETEHQAMRRLLRPDQTRPVTLERLMLRGSIDEYMGQMVAFKADAAAAGLDWATPQYADQEFLHLDKILCQFCDDLAELLGTERRHLRAQLAATA